MGCVSSSLLNQEEDFTQLGRSGLGHHIVSLTSTTYGLLTLDSPTPPPPPQTDPPLHHNLPTPLSPLPEPKSLRSEPEVINSWELMAGLDTDSFRLSPIPLPSPSKTPSPKPLFMNNKENSDPNTTRRVMINGDVRSPPSSSVTYSLDTFEERCPPNGENKVVLYTTTLRGVRKTFEECNAVRSALEGVGVLMSERDVSMDRGFREELRELMSGKENGGLIPPRVFVKGRYIGGAEEVLRIHEEGCLAEILQGLPKTKIRVICDGCGGVGFLPCFQCDGSCKLVMIMKTQQQQQQRRKVVVRCPDCNENGLVLCPICS